MNSEEDTLLEIKGISEASLEKIYDAVQNFVEKNQAKAEAQTEENEKLTSESETNDDDLISAPKDNNKDETPVIKKPEQKIESTLEKVE